MGPPKVEGVSKTLTGGKKMQRLLPSLLFGACHNFCIVHAVPLCQGYYDPGAGEGLPVASVALAQKKRVKMGAFSPPLCSNLGPSTYDLKGEARGGSCAIAKMSFCDRSTAATDVDCNRGKMHFSESVDAASSAFAFLLQTFRYLTQTSSTDV